MVTAMNLSSPESSFFADSFTAVSDRRVHQRFAGPFDGRRIGALETPVRIYDLSRGGCFNTSMHEQQPGIQLTLKIDLPPEGWITFAAETLPRQNEFGFAVRFTAIDPDDGVRFLLALKRLEERQPYDP
jgi:hypothetical protein